jgi:hypothetical protein
VDRHVFPLGHIILIYESTRRGAQLVFIGMRDCLLKNKFTKHSTHIVNQKLKHFDDVSFRDSFAIFSGCFFKISFVLKQGIGIYVHHYFILNTVDRVEIAADVNRFKLHINKPWRFCLATNKTDKPFQDNFFPPKRNRNQVI